jgi:dihydrofolate synthase/folylpolyglutamate synthase
VQQKMTYRETVDYLFNALPMYQRVGGPAYKANLDNAYCLDNELSHPHTKYRTIHVAGTNGKGSVSHILASVLQAEGYRTGLYTSPHLIDFRERIRINGMPVAEKFVIEFTENHRRLFEHVNPSFFEMTAFMAFEYFAQQNADIAIIETGLGGRLDTTNIIVPEVSVITNIGKDHTQFLGDTIEKIAIEKAGIIKEGIPVVIGETQKNTRDIFRKTAENRNCKLYFADQHYSVSFRMKNTDGTVSHNFNACHHWNFNTLDTDLQGKYQRSNIITSLMTLALLDEGPVPVKPGAVRTGLKQVTRSTGLAGRWQVAGHNPPVICDIAHNKEGIGKVLEQIDETPYKNLSVVLGFVSDKDIGSILDILPVHAKYYLCEPDIPRAMKVSVLAEKCRQKDLDLRSYNKVSEAYRAAKNDARPEDLIFIGGSTFVVADFLRWKNPVKTF